MSDNSTSASEFERRPPLRDEVVGGQVFLTTHWSVVLSAQDKDSPRSAEALETLCRSYWYPLYAFVRQQGRSPHDAQDLTQEFFARLLQKDYLQSAARRERQVPHFFAGGIEAFLANEWDRQHAQKRGGFAPGNSD